LPGLVRLDDIRSTRFARNPRIARALADLDYGRKLGEGVNLMYEEMERAVPPDPVFFQTAASLRVTFLADPLSARIIAALPPGSERFVEHLSRSGRVTTSQAIQLLGVSRPMALAYLHRLEARGLIEDAVYDWLDQEGLAGRTTWTIVAPDESTDSARPSGLPMARPRRPATARRWVTLRLPSSRQRPSRGALPTLPSVGAIVAGRGYRGLRNLADRRHLRLDMKAPPKGRPGFIPLAPLYGIEHVFAQLGRWRRLSRCYEGTTASATAWLEVASVGYLAWRAFA
jgi:hypothetical protein